MKEPGWHLLYLQVVLLACLIAPLAQSWSRPVYRSSTPPRVIGTMQSGGATGGTPPLDVSALLAPVLLTGFLCRIAWLGLGLWRLQCYRRHSHDFESSDGAVAAAFALTGTRARFAVSNEISGPVTFGRKQPLVLVTPAFGALPQAQQLAIACHELIHVKRRDWFISLLEEAAATMLWFHPAVWWTLQQIRLAREHAVDAEVVRLTGSRQDYVEALLTMAQARWQLDLAPAPLFLRRRHLMDRIQQLLKEATMSRRRIYASYASMITLLTATAWFSSATFPLTAAPQFPAVTSQKADGVLERIDVSRLNDPDRTRLRDMLSSYPNKPFSTDLMRAIERDARTVDRTLTFTWTMLPNRNHTLVLSHAPVPSSNSQLGFQPTEEKRIELVSSVAAAKLTYAPRPEYPALAKLAGQEGVAVMAVLIGKDGHVKDAYGLRGPSLLQAAAGDAIRNWIYRTTLLNGEPIEVVTTVEIPFNLPE